VANVGAPAVVSLVVLVFDWALPLGSWQKG